MSSDNITTEKSKYGKIRFISIIILALAIACTGFLGGMYATQKSETLKRLADKEVIFTGEVLGKYAQIGDSDKYSQDIQFDLFWEVWDMLKSQYVNSDDLTDKKLFYGALEGLVSAAGDPYTVFMDPITSQEFEDDLAGTFEGIGAEIGIKSEILTIISPLADSPALKAGLKAGDKVYAIDGESTAGLSIDEAVSKIRGQKGTVVKLTIFRNGAESAQDISITRDVIVVKSVITEFRDDKIYTITISSFNDDTSDLVNKAVLDITKKNPKGIILDLRNNPGGYLDSAVEIAGHWIENGLIVTEKFDEEKSNGHSSRGQAKLKDFKTVILVNEGSASASEIVAGALKDHGKATVIGKKTYGKGSVQMLESLKDGSSVKITVAEWLTPNGTNINHEGIEPDKTIELTPEDYDESRDPQMDEAIKYLNE